MSTTVEDVKEFDNDGPAVRVPLRRSDVHTHAMIKLVAAG